jgi:hypothetical protein
VTKLSNRVLISLWAVPTPTGSVSCRRTFRTDLAFQNLMFFDTRESDFRALQGKLLEGLDFRGFWYTD